MKCLKCNCLESKVLDSRYIEKNNSVRRRRECLNCGERFTTYEMMEVSPIVVVKRDNSLENFDREKIKRGILTALEKRPVSIDKVEEILNNIENKLHSEYKGEVKSSIIGNLVLSELKKLDEVAYVRFASVYKSFDSLDEFKILLFDLNNNK